MYLDRWTYHKKSASPASPSERELLPTYLPAWVLMPWLAHGLKKRKEGRRKKKGKRKRVEERKKEKGKNE